MKEIIRLFIEKQKELKKGDILDIICYHLTNACVMELALLFIVTLYRFIAYGI